MLGFFVIKGLVKLAVALVAFAVLALVLLYLLGAVKKQHPGSLARTILHTATTVLTPHSGTTATSTTPAARTRTGTAAGIRSGRRRPAAGTPGGAHCGAIAVNAHASCGFAENVAHAYQAQPASTVIARSPVTHQTYTVHCRASGAIVTCVGGTGNDASISFRAPAPGG